MINLEPTLGKFTLIKSLLPTFITKLIETKSKNTKIKFNKLFWLINNGKNFF